MASISPTSTPKRKRAQLLTDDVSDTDASPFSKFSFHVTTPPSSVDDGSASPRTKVAHKFRGLVLDGGGGVALRGTAHAGQHGRSLRSPDRERRPTGEAMDVDMEGEAYVRKRVKLPDGEMENTQALDVAGSRTGGAELQGTFHDGIALSNPEIRIPGGGDSASLIQQQAALQTPNGAALDPTLVKPLEPTATSSKKHATGAAASSARQRAELKSSHRKQASTPPLHAAHRPGPHPGRSSSPSTVDQDHPSGGTAAPAPDSVVDPLRASLTWHEDEITVYDPDDSDDDGTGINGIGFKPTPAMAYARTVRRRQQLAEYRKREEREARARRNQRRRTGRGPSPAVGSAPSGAGADADAGLVGVDEGVKGQERRVRFMEEPGVRVC